MFWLVSTVRHAATKLGRVTSPQRHRRKQYVCGGAMRLVPSRPQPITEAQLVKHYEELYALQQQGIVRVHKDSVEGPVFRLDIKPGVEEKSIDEEVIEAAENNGARELQEESVDSDIAAEVVAEVAAVEEPVTEAPAAEEPAAVEEQATTSVEEPAEKPDFTRMSKTALLEWLYANTSAKVGSYDEHSKKELIKIAEGV